MLGLKLFHMNENGPMRWFTTMTVNSELCWAHTLGNLGQNHV